MATAAIVISHKMRLSILSMIVSSKNKTGALPNPVSALLFPDNNSCVLEFFRP
jgi:hypothetical protein